MSLRARRRITWIDGFPPQNILLRCYLWTCTCPVRHVRHRGKDDVDRALSCGHRWRCVSSRGRGGELVFEEPAVRGGGVGEHVTAGHERDPSLVAHQQQRDSTIRGRPVRERMRAESDLCAPSLLTTDIRACRRRLPLKTTEGCVI